MINYFFRLLMNNIGYKLSALVLALIVWGIVQGEEVVESNVKIKISLNVASGFAVRGELYRTVDATLRGPRVLLGDTTARALEAKIYIPSGQTGNLEIPFERDYLRNLDNRIRVTLRNNYISVFVDELVDRDVALKEVLQGTPPSGYFVEKTILTPDKISITGLKADLAKTSELLLEPVDVSKLKESTEMETAVIYDPTIIKSISSRKVKVQVQIADSKENKTFDSVAITSIGTDNVVRASVKNITVVIQGTAATLSLVDVSKLGAFVDATGLKPGRYEKDVQVKIPPDTVLIQVIPQKVVVEVLAQKRK